MKNENLRNYLNGLPIPEPDEASRREAIQSAMMELRRQAENSNEKVKVSSGFGRLMGKLLKGGPIMQRPIAITSGIAAGFIALAIVLSPVFVSQQGDRNKQPVIFRLFRK